ncbi:hypothetical protein CKM354_000934800 [Cercospora kikuchii]|uniref:P-loop containing nucleoside triphosphate hydrolase protein n=1 Tax=Cercospora kikuchii TaxID=84275 RepID=A0A9P3CXE3_9PEZI|nr:uncharacterized protein CKM354_000934800 [Cercospora kikuchii]GIZ46213.1 hypothetical protein CKM354_000934800 [Cercospora kikuchii]
MALIWKPHEATQTKVREAEDATTNPLSGQVFSAQHKVLLADRRTLPMQAGDHCQTFLNYIKDNTVVILTGATGSGKTTQVPAWLYFACGVGHLQKNEQQILVGQPRRLPTIACAERVAKELDVGLGAEVGIKVRNLDTKSNKTGMTFVTDGMLINLLKQDQGVSKYAAMVIDEAHDRTANTDIALAILRDVVVGGKRPNFRLVIMSATLTTALFANFFAGKSIVQTVPGVTYPTEIFYLPDLRLGQKDYDVTDMIAQTILDIHCHEETGTILVFVAGERQCRDVIRTAALKLRGYDEDRSIQFLELHGHLSHTDQENAVRALAPTRKDGRGRLCIAATNLAETSLTIPDVTFVVDSLQQTFKVYNPRTMKDILFVGPVSRQSAQQRAGRAGRTRPGKVYRMCTEATWLLQQPQRSPASMSVSDTASSMMTLYALGKNPLAFNLLEPPAMETMMRALEELYHLDFIDVNGKLTKLGEQAVTLSVEPHHARILLQSYHLGCSGQMLSILAMLEATEGRSPFLSRPGDYHVTGQYDNAKRRLINKRGAFMTLLDVYTEWRLRPSEDDGTQFCSRNWLRLNVMRMADKARVRMTRTMVKAGIKINSLWSNDPNYYTTITRALCLGYFRRSAFRLKVGGEDSSKKDKKDKQDAKPEDKYLTLRGGVAAEVLFHDRLPSEASGNFCIYESVATSTSGKTTLSMATAVPPEFLIEACPRYWDMETFPSHGDNIRPKQALTAVLQRMTRLSEAELLGGWPEL